MLELIEISGTRVSRNAVRVRVVEKHSRREPLFQVGVQLGVHKPTKRRRRTPSVLHTSSQVIDKGEQDFKEAARTESRIKYLINERHRKYKARVQEVWTSAEQEASQSSKQAYSRQDQGKHWE